MLSLFYYAALVVLLGILCEQAISRYRFGKNYKLPVKIPGIPILGNTLQIPALHQGVWGRAMAQKYGEMYASLHSLWVFVIQGYARIL